jgi:hypothetical protein
LTHPTDSILRRYARNATGNVEGVEAVEMVDERSEEILFDFLDPFDSSTLSQKRCRGNWIPMRATATLVRRSIGTNDKAIPD